GRRGGMPRAADSRPEAPPVTAGSRRAFQRRDHHLPIRRTLLIALLLTVALTGCVRRRLTVRSDPPGALVLIDDQEIGHTPVATSYVYYGTRKIQLIKDGYETQTVLQP